MASGLSSEEAPLPEAIRRLKLAGGLTLRSLEAFADVPGRGELLWLALAYHLEDIGFHHPGLRFMRGGQSFAIPLSELVSPATE